MAIWEGTSLEPNNVICVPSWSLFESAYIMFYNIIKVHGIGLRYLHQNVKFMYIRQNMEMVPSNLSLFKIYSYRDTNCYYNYLTFGY